MKIPFYLSLAGVLASIIAMIMGIYATFAQQRTELPIQIKEVEDAIRNLRNLDQYLEKTKSEMIATKQAKEKIEQEYDKAKELENLTEKQLEAISLAVNRRSIKDIAMDYFWGFMLGLAGSLFASYIYASLRRKRSAK